MAAKAADALPVPPDFAGVEQRSGGKLGIFVIDTETGKTLGWRADDRFPFCSSTKGPLAAFVLWKADRHEIGMDQLVHYSEADLLPWAPVTRAAVAKGALPFSELCRAAVTLSDNTAANLLWRETGGPKSLTAWMRREGDRDYDLSSIEPALNRARYGDRHNTTTPRAMTESYRRFVFGDVLKPASRAMLTECSYRTRQVASASAPDCRRLGRSATRPAPITRHGSRRQILP